MAEGTRSFSQLNEALLTRLSVNNARGNDDFAGNINGHDTTLEGVGETHYKELGDRGLPKRVRLEIPRFSGHNSLAWVYRVNQYFLFHQIPPGQRIFIASFHLDDEALIWFQDASEAGVFHSWDEFVQALQVRFGSSPYDDPMESLTRLKQVSSVTTYKIEFELLSNRIKGIFEKNKLSCFLSGLRDEIRLPVRMLKPSNLNDAFGLAKIQEQYVWSTKKSWKSNSFEGHQQLWNGNTNKSGPSNSILGAPKGQPISRMPYQRISEAQMQDRRKKGLCYFCEDKWHPGHKCARPKLYVMEGMDFLEGVDGLAELEPNQSIEEEQDQLPGPAQIASISIQAMMGTPSPKTMKVIGQLKKKEVLILIDSDSTHNFVDTMVAVNSGLCLHKANPMQVKIANGDVVSSEGVCSAVEIQIQGTTIVSDFCTLELGSCDVVLGVQWLLSLGPILWDFQKLQMQFQVEGRAISWQGLSFPCNLVIKDADISSITGLEHRSMFLHMISVNSQEDFVQEPEMITQLLSRFSKVFEEPSGLPPQRSHDHQINLKQGSVPGGVKADPKKLEAMISWPLPKNVKGLRGFLGLTGYYRKFIKCYGLIAAPLTALLKKDAFVWNSEATKAFGELKAAVTSPPVLALPDFTKGFIIECDACANGVGAVLMQDQRPLAFLSQALKGKNLLLSTYENEFLALVLAVKKWRPYLLGGTFVVRTDHHSLKYLLEQKVGIAAQQKWLAKLLGYEFTIEYKKGVDNKVADALSRKNECEDLMSLNAISIPNPTWLEEIRKAYDKDPVIKQLLNEFQQGQSPSNLTLKQGILFRKWRIYIPNCSELKLKVLHYVHASPLAGHSGFHKSLHRARINFYWPGLKIEVKKFICECEVCQRNKSENILPAGLLQPLPIPQQIWTDVSMDFVEGLPVSKGFSVVMVVVDRVSKYAHFLALKHPFTAATVAALFLNNIFKLHGMRSSIVSDRGATFTSDKPKGWFEWLPLAEWWYNTTCHASTKMTPYEAVYGVPPVKLQQYIPGLSQNQAVEELLRTREEILGSFEE
ncbi:uncharacterized protein LOC118349426 [Juglans regia]|uniref:Uncharacterized protein LOC118349426 n=1 Tax=Juglans regia TaxID=51240 RepID=A0A6P9EQ48_JUGRE|nr:uncharacterized protein LOC118349426 [Juglans regia]